MFEYMLGLSVCQLLRETALPGEFLIWAGVIPGSGRAKGGMLFWRFQKWWGVDFEVAGVDVVGPLELELERAFRVLAAQFRHCPAPLIQSHIQFQEFVLVNGIPDLI